MISGCLRFERWSPANYPSLVMLLGGHEGQDNDDVEIKSERCMGMLLLTLALNNGNGGGDG